MLAIAIHQYVCIVMDNKEFKEIFNRVAARHNFENAFGGWFKDSSECILALDLQKSNFSNIYYLNIKIYVQGAFDKIYVKSKDLIKKDIGDIFRRQPPIYNDLFDMTAQSDAKKTKETLDILFEEFIVPFSNSALSKSGIEDLEANGEIYILPAVKKELEKIN